jgi:hypothetical protein
VREETCGRQISVSNLFPFLLSPDSVELEEVSCLSYCVIYNTKGDEEGEKELDPSNDA